MPITVGDFLAVLEKLAPVALAEDWDNCGLQVGGAGMQTGSVLVTLNVTAEVLDEAVALGCGLILTHHPLIFRPLHAVSDESDAGLLSRRATVDGISIVSAHTNLDAASGGLADIMAGLIGLEDVDAVVAPASGGAVFKLVVFVPPKDLGPVRAALFGAGTGVIGDYRHCSFYSGGTGTFLPVEGADPTIGSIGIDESVEEYRLETLVAPEELEDAVAAMIVAHSYEEPAYDVYPLATIGKGSASGRIGSLPGAATTAELAGRIATRFGLTDIRFTPAVREPVTRVAVVPGSGAGFIGTLDGSVDVLITGDLKYHDTYQAREAGIGLIELSHDVSESVALKHWLPVLESELGDAGVSVKYSRSATSIWEEITANEESAETMAGPEEGENLRLHVDGGARGNPGPAGIGAVLLDGEGNTVAELAEVIGEATNNVAEYKALIAGVEMALGRGISSLDIYSDSELIVKQIDGSYRVKNAGLRPLFDQAKAALSRLESYRLIAVRREENAHADALVNKALDEDSD
jgi:dinuclear metal center YbgI/SA1388 family protein